MLMPILMPDADTNDSADAYADADADADVNADADADDDNDADADADADSYQGLQCSMKSQSRSQFQAMLEEDNYFICFQCCKKLSRSHTSL